MNGAENSRVEKYLTLISVAADTLSILAFAGFTGSEPLRITFVLLLSVVGIVCATTVLVGSLRLSLSVEGKFYPTTYHTGRLVTAAGALVVAIALAWGAISLIGNPNDGTTPVPASTSASSVDSKG